MVCGGMGDFSADVSSHPDALAEELEFGEDSYRVLLDDSTQLRVALGGLTVQITEGGSTRNASSSRAWSPLQGQVAGFAPEGLPACPSDTWPISLSTFDEGWLMVCGTDSGPSSMAFSGETIGSGEASQVEEQEGSYCGTILSQTVCVFQTPSVIVVSDSGGAVLQSSVSDNWFPKAGKGGAGLGSGFFQVPAPAMTAEDQVRYLVDILNESAAARSRLNPAVDNVSRCRDVSSAVDTIAGVTQNRYDLLEALDSTPVDQIEGGFELLSLLRESLETSAAADEAWLAWAESERDNGCAQGSRSSLYKNAQAVNRHVDRPKNGFVNMWNSRIAPEFGVKKFTRAEI